MQSTLPRWDSTGWDWTSVDHPTWAANQSRSSWGDTEGGCHPGRDAHAQLDSRLSAWAERSGGATPRSSAHHAATLANPHAEDPKRSPRLGNVSVQTDHKTTQSDHRPGTCRYSEITRWSKNDHLYVGCGAWRTTQRPGKWSRQEPCRNFSSQEHMDDTYQVIYNDDDDLRNSIHEIQNKTLVWKTQRKKHKN